MSEKYESHEEQGTSSKTFWIILISIKVILIVGILALVFIPRHAGKGSIQFTEMHGLGYTKNGVLIMSVKSGLALYNNGKWSKSIKKQNHYTGFSMVTNGFYSSGTTSNHSNPLGIVKVTNNGKNVSSQSLSGKANFQKIAAGYYSEALYVYNPSSNSIMPKKGLYYSLDKGKTWTFSGPANIKGQISAIAVDPKQKNKVAVGTDQGVFYSQDYGKTFKQYLKGNKVTALSYGFNHELLVATFDGQSSLSRLDPSNGGAAYEVDLSSVEREPILYIAENPNDVQQVVIAIKNKDVFYTNTMGKNWSYLAKNGQGLAGQ